MPPCVLLPRPVHPHARGAECRCRPAYCYPGRFIPTHVGQRTSGLPLAAFTPVHPHARGAEAVGHLSARSGADPVHPHARGAECPKTCLARMDSRFGSSPRTWGRAASLLARRRWLRLTVHPHARGAECSGLELVFRRTLVGSSPRTWGRDPASNAQCSRVRFIPTHVGQRRQARRGRPPAAVHPHARGAEAAITEFAGSMRLRPVHPHARGAEVQLRNLKAVELTAVHPHARGAEIGFRPGLFAEDGSSPRTWGRERRQPIMFSTERFIPTHVGQSPI